MGVFFWFLVSVLVMMAAVITFQEWCVSTVKVKMAAIQKSTESILLSKEEVDAIKAARAAQVSANEIVKEYIERLKTHKKGE